MQLILVFFFAEPLYRHMKDQHIEFLQFAFRWMNNLLMRELPVRCTIRLWDTYLVGLAFFYSSRLENSHRLNKMVSLIFICIYAVHFWCDFPKIFYAKKIFK